MTHGRNEEGTDVNKPSVSPATVVQPTGCQAPTTTSVRKRKTSLLLSLADDAIFLILKFCDLQSLGRLCRVCRRLNLLTRSDCVWIWQARRMSVIREPSDRNGGQNLSAKEICRLTTNWKTSTCKSRQVIYQKTRHMPWLQKDGSNFWLSYKNFIQCYTQNPVTGVLTSCPDKIMIGHQDDICRFAVKGETIVSCGRDKNIIVWNSATSKCSDFIPLCHDSDIDCVDFHENVIVSGSRDTTIKIWKLNRHTSNTHQLMKTLDLNDRVWSILICHDVRYFVTGSAGCNQVAPLHLWDLERGNVNRVLGSNFRHGAGIRDIQYHTEHIILSCGYDTYLRLWDLRTSCDKSVLGWADPFDSTIYSVKSDGHHAVMTGTARHGLVRLWDTRMDTPVMQYYNGKACSPVYSLAFDPAHLYVALDRGVSMLDFGIWKRTSGRAGSSRTAHNNP